MVNRKMSRILGPTLGVMGFMIALGFMEAPAFADSTGTMQSVGQAMNTTTQAAAAYTADMPATENKDYFVNINKSQTQNGIKVTVDKALATKHNIKVMLKIESDKPFDKTGHGDSIFEITYGDNYSNHTRSFKRDYLDDKTMLLTLEQDNYEGEYPVKGDLRVDVVFSNYKVNLGMDIPVDFTEAFKNIIEKDVSGTIPEFNYTLNSMESDVMGTTINYAEPERDEDTSDKENSLWRSIMILKVGDRMYKVNSNGSYTGKNKEIMGNYKSKLATYDRVKDEKNISLMPIISNITEDDFEKINEQNNNENQKVKQETTSNVSYEKDFDFSDGSKGEIYKLERNDNSIKIYCKGASEKESILMASDLFANYQYVKGSKKSSMYDEDNISFYKDPNDTLGYVVELDNVEKDRAMNIRFDDMIKQVDKYTLEDEIDLLK